MKKNIVRAAVVGLVAVAAATFVFAQEVSTYISGGQVVANFQKGGPYGGSYTGGTYLIYSSLPSYVALQTVASGAVQADSVGYTTTVAKAASAVQPVDATYTATVAKAASAVQPTDAAYTNTAALAAGAVQATAATYTATVAKAASAVQATDAAYTNTAALAASAVQATDAAYTNTAALAAGAVQASAGMTLTNTWFSGPTDSVTNIQVFINGQLVSWSTNGTAL